MSTCPYVCKPVSARVCIRVCVYGGGNGVTVSGVRGDRENKLGSTVPQVRGPDVAPVSVTGFALDEDRWQPLFFVQCEK